MAETAKILNPSKTVLIPDLDAGCSLSDSITAADVRLMKERYPGVKFDQFAGAEMIAEKLECAIGTVYKWRKRYSADGLRGLEDRPRPGQPTKLTRATIDWVLSTTTERIPKEATHWSIRRMAEYAGITPWQVQQICKSADLKPHRLKTFKISNDPQFAEKVVDVVGLYMNPPDNAMVLSVDEKTQIQALDRTQPMLPLRPGQIERRTHDSTTNAMGQ